MVSNINKFKKEARAEKKKRKKRLAVWKKSQERLKLEIGLSILSDAYGYTHLPALSGELATSTSMTWESLVLLTSKSLLVNLGNVLGVILDT